MRFGSFAFPSSLDPANDSVVIDNTLREVELVEEMGYDAVWLNEHHFDGASAFADPLVFGAAVAARTSRLTIGFAVVELALHHPVRLAAQTALLDNLSHGRLIVGIGRGSAFNHYEYRGFGTTMERGIESLAEGEDLLVKAWTGTDVQHQGEYWDVAFPALRPRPFQKPHPPMVRACISDESVVAMAAIGRPILTSARTPAEIRERLELYRQAMLKSGFDETAADSALDRTWVAKDMVVSETDTQAEEIAFEAMETEHVFFNEFRKKHNPAGTVNPDVPGRDDLGLYHLHGSPESVAEQVADLRDAGVRNLMFKFNAGQMDQADVERSIRLFGQKVMPRFRQV